MGRILHYFAKGRSRTKTLGNTSAESAKNSVNDIQVWGDGDAWQLICKASSQSEGWMKSTKAMPVGDDCLVQISTQQRNPDGSYVISEVCQIVKDVKIWTVYENNDPKGKPLRRYLDKNPHHRDHLLEGADIKPIGAIAHES